MSLQVPVPFNISQSKRTRVVKSSSSCTASQLAHANIRAALDEVDDSSARTSSATSGCKSSGSDSEKLSLRGRGCSGILGFTPHLYD